MLLITKFQFVVFFLEKFPIFFVQRKCTQNICDNGDDKLLFCVIGLNQVPSRPCLLPQCQRRPFGVRLPRRSAQQLRRPPLLFHQLQDRELRPKCNFSYIMYSLISLLGLKVDLMGFKLCKFQLFCNNSRDKLAKRLVDPLKGKSGSGTKVKISKR